MHFRITGPSIAARPSCLDWIALLTSEPTTAWRTEWIADPAALDAAFAGHVPTDIGLDTEFLREKTYWPQLALVQIALPDANSDGNDSVPASGRILLVDPLVSGMDAAIARMLRDQRMRKLMHSAGEDLIALQHTCGAVPEPLFDTQTAAALSGVGAGIGYQKLVHALLGENVDKGETRSDWVRRPLSPAQLRYAADDAHVIYGTAYDDALGEEIRVTVVATGLSRQAARRTAPPLQVLRTGTDNVPFHVPTLNTIAQPSGAAAALGGTGHVATQPDYGSMATPSVWRTNRTQAAAKVDALSSGGMDDYEIPAFLRKQAD